MVPPKSSLVNLMSELCAQLCADFLLSARKAARGTIILGGEMIILSKLSELLEKICPSRLDKEMANL